MLLIFMLLFQIAHSYAVLLIFMLLFQIAHKINNNIYSYWNVSIIIFEFVTLMIVLYYRVISHHQQSTSQPLVVLAPYSTYPIIREFLIIEWWCVVKIL